MNLKVLVNKLQNYQTSKLTYLLLFNLFFFFKILICVCYAYDRAMGGVVPLNEAIKLRLDLIKPSKNDLINFQMKHETKITPKITEVISILQSRGVHIYIVSGGFREMIQPFATKYNIPSERIYANSFIFDLNDNYLNFNQTEITSHDGGKPAVIQRLKDLYHYKHIIMIGDGVTDLQTKPTVDAFIGFGGVAVREVVKAQADWFITDFQELLDVLKE